MSYSVQFVGKDKAKLKAAVRAEQSSDEVNAPHSGVPAWVVERLCVEIDRARIYAFPARDGKDAREMCLEVKAHGSFHEGGAEHHYTVGSAGMQFVE